VGGPAVAEGRKTRTEKLGGCFIIIIINSRSRLMEDNYCPFVQVPDYSPSSQFDLDDFNLNYLDNNTNVYPQKAFQDAFENTCEKQAECY
jgi:hypothetical protein